MSLRHALLGLLAAGPATGYELSRSFDASLRHAWHASHSQVYPELARLESLGLVEEVGQGPRRSRTWAITDAGRGELRRWLVDELPSRTQRSETALRWFLLPLLAPEERRRAVEREIRSVEESTAMLEGITAAMRDERAARTFEPTADLGLRLNEVMLAWLREQLPAE
ncbi:DNA-binding PadR family transcriptional regulator [Motilibacter peucedani]|uniref:DNA-binding PadR family transcriptional regulator n=1 Tax=Motilibacter peucedani TaxID=598650 RepID=A0A420XQL1_9ACTN|nr:PadR family transcriptional regulator [Motilibacter peucedani]RKS75598.1 DNA-binding PadR family transcriptional regulator [Motilibacter peucedani]